jgi:hypothetical protein
VSRAAFRSVPELQRGDHRPLGCMEHSTRSLRQDRQRRAYPQKGKLRPEAPQTKQTRPHSSHSIARSYAELIPEH